jgi:trimeric autotransporter adhesin
MAINTSFRRVLLASTSVMVLGSASVAHANPKDGQIIDGTATIESELKKLNIYQKTDRLIIDWRSFDIESDEHTQFHQPSDRAVALNRIGSGDHSRILGKLSANGNVVLINPNGVFFGKDSRVDVNGIIATAADIDNIEFMKNEQLHFNKPGAPDAAIINAGHITAKEAGLVALVAPHVANNGIIEARMGHVELASGDSVMADLYGDGLYELKVSNDVKINAISNTGSITAAGGTVALTAAAAKEIVNSLITIKGELRAPSVSQKNGRIIISAAGSNAVEGNKADDKGKKQGGSTVVIADTYLDVSGRNIGERGGHLRITGDNLALLDGTLIDASGHSGASGTTRTLPVYTRREDAAGGDIQIGGDYLGLSDTPTAKNLYVDAGVLILNDSLFSGDAGRTIFWSDDTTKFYGNVYARALGGLGIDPLTWNAIPGDLSPGALTKGDGGFVETSGKVHLHAGGHVDLTASSGNRGTYFLDPTNITINGNFDPTDVANGRLWLDASQITGVSNGQRVSIWDDLFGTNDATAFATGPTYISNTLNGNPVLRFTSANGMRAPRMSFTDWSIFMIFRDTANQTAYERLLDHDYINGFWFGRNNSTASSFGGGVKEAGDPYGRFVTVADGQWNLIGNQRAGTIHNVWANGNFSGGASGTVNGTATASNQLGIGMWHNNGTPGQQASNIDIAEVIIYSDDLSNDNRNLIEQYQSAKWGIALTPPGMGATEVARATAADGYSVFTTRYLERLSQSANVSLQATNNISLDLQGDTLNFSTSGRSLTLTAGNQINTASTGTITTNNGAISLTSTNGILFNHDFSLNSAGGNITFNNAVDGAGALAVNAGAGAVSFASTVGATTPLGSLTVTGPTRLGGNITTNNGNITFNNAVTSSVANTWSTGTGNITLNSTYTGTSGNLTLSAAQIDINNTLNVGTNTLSLKPTTAKSIRVGRSTDNGDDANYLDISAAEMARIQAGTVSIGDAALASATTIAGNINTTGATAAAGVYNLAFNTGGTFDSSGYTINLGRDAVSLDGSNDFMHVPSGYTDLFSGDNSTTLSTWFYARNVTNDPVLFDSEDGAYSDLFYELSSARGFYWAAGGTFRTYTGGVFNLNEWNHLAFVKTGTNAGDIYLNGSVVTNYTGNFSSQPTASGDLLIGKFKNGYNFNGIMDDIRIYNTALDTTGIGNLYNSGAGGAFLLSETGLRAAYGFSEGSGTTATNVSASGVSNATLTNGPTWVRAQNLTVNAGGAVTIGNAYGDGSVIDITGSAVTLAGKVAAMGDGTLNIASTNNITINSGASANAGGTGNSLVLRSSAGNFINNADASALSAANGRWIVYSQSAAADTLGGLGAAQTINGQSYGTLAPSAITGPTYNASQNTFVYSSAPAGGILRFTADNKMRYYGDANPVFTYSFWCSTGCTEADAVTGAPSLTTTATQSSNVGSYAVSIAQGLLSRTTGYAAYTFDFVDGFLTVGPREVTAALQGTVSKVYDRTVSAALSASNYVLNNVYGSDDVVLNNPVSGTYDDYNVGTGKTVSVTGLSISGTKAANYTLASTVASGAVGEIIAKALSITGLTADNKVYNRSTTATLSGTGALDGVEAGDTVTLGGTYSANFADWNVGTNKAITVSGYTLGGANSHNYTLTQPTSLTANIAPKTLTAGLTGTIYKTYNGDDFASIAVGNYTLSGTIIGDTVALNSPAVGTYDNKNAGTGKTVTVTGLSLLGGSAGNYQLASTSISGPLGTILAKTLSILGITAKNKVYDGTTTAAVNAESAMFSGKISGDDVSLNSGTLSANFTDKNVGAGKAITVSGFSLSGADANNYSLDTGSFTGTTANITQRALTVSADAKTKTYGAADPTFTYTYGALATGDTSSIFSGALSRTSGNNVGTYAIDIGSLSAGGNYNISYTGANLIINPANLTITANNATRMQGTPNPTFGASYNGFQYADDASSISDLRITTDASASAMPGTYKIKPSGAIAANYTISFIDGLLTVSPAQVPNTVQFVSQITLIPRPPTRTMNAEQNNRSILTLQNDSTNSTKDDTQIPSLRYINQPPNQKLVEFHPDIVTIFRLQFNSF